MEVFRKNCCMKKWIFLFLMMIIAQTAFSQVLLDQKRNGRRVISTHAAVLTDEGKSPLVYIGYSVQIEGSTHAYYLTVGIKSNQPISKVNAGDRLLLKIGNHDVLKFTAQANSQFSRSGQTYYSNSSYRINKSDIDRIARAQRVRIAMADDVLDIDVARHAYRNTLRQANEILKF